MFHAVGLLAGLLAGIWVAEFVQARASLPPIFAAVVVAMFIFISQLIAYSLSRARREAPAVPVMEIPTSRVSETWGWLKPASGFGTGFALIKDMVHIGRGVENDITLNNASISRRHAELQRLMDGCLVRDLASRNGVFVNGMRVQEQLLSDGDSIALGEMRFVFAQEDTRARIAAAESFAAPTSESLAYRPTEEFVRRGPRDNNDSSKEGAYESGELPQRGARPFDDTSEFQADAEQ